MKCNDVISLTGILTFMVVSLSSCELAGDIFQAGMGVGIGIVVLVIAIIIFVIIRLGKRG